MPETGAPPAPSLVKLLGRHQVASLAATAADFGVMVAAVESHLLRPVAATVVGACAGALANFLLGRYFTYRATSAAPAGQAARYALVSVASLALNAGGEALLYGVLGLQYLLARLLTALAVSFLWNFPLQRHFVFATRTAPEGRA